MSKSTSKQVAKAMFEHHRGKWIKGKLDQAYCVTTSGLHRSQVEQMLSEAWDRGIAQGRKMGRKGIE